ncbi:MAG TPA: hypothetical protein VHS78_01545 [Candidatus Elarobacter sp.]|nr:hypothetical protein [Candidatus Elarobacter sp.]
MEPYHLVRFAGHLDVSRYPEFRAAFEAVPRGVPVLVDLLLADSVDSTFLSELLLFKRRHDASLAVVIPPAGHVARLCEIVNLDRKLGVYADLSLALDALGVTPKTRPLAEDVVAD